MALLVIRRANVAYFDLAKRVVAMVLEDELRLTAASSVLRGIVLQRNVGRSAFKLKLRAWSSGADAQPIVCLINNKRSSIDLKVGQDCGSTLAIEVVVEAVTILNQQADGKFEVNVTIDGCENFQTVVGNNC